MTHIVQELADKKKISPPSFLPKGIHYLTVMGSHAYGLSTEESDLDVYGWCVPPQDIVFPHVAGIIPGFGHQGIKFEHWQEHHIIDPVSVKEYDFSVYNVVRFFDLAMENNPNLVDAMFTPEDCVLYSTPVARMIRENRRLFLSRNCWHKFRGYAYAQLKKARAPRRDSKRSEMVEKYGYDVKSIAHCIRLMNEVEQILKEGDLDLRKNTDVVRSIRNGEWTLERVEELFHTREIELTQAYSDSKLPYTPNELAIKRLLLAVLEDCYGTVQKATPGDQTHKVLIHKIIDLIRESDPSMLSTSVGAQAPEVG